MMQLESTVIFIPPVFSAHGMFGTEQFLETSKKTENANHKIFQAFGLLVSCSNHLSEDNIPNPYISHHDCRGDDHFNLKVFDGRYKMLISSPQNVKISTTAGKAVVAGAYGVAIIRRRNSINE